MTELQKLIACRDTHLRYSPAWVKLTIKIIRLKNAQKPSKRRHLKNESTHGP